MQSTPPKYIGFALVARRYGIDPYTVWRWHRVGRGKDRVKLQAIKCGGRWRTRWKWVRQFFAALDPGPAPPIESRTQRARGHEAVMRELERMGVKPVKLGAK